MKIKIIVLIVLVPVFAGLNIFVIDFLGIAEILKQISPIKKTVYSIYTMFWGMAIILILNWVIGD